MKNIPDLSIDELDDEIRLLEEMDDGSSVYEIGPEISEDVDTSFNANLAINELSTEALRKIATYLDEQIEMDIEARQPWLDSINRVKDVLGFNVEDLNHNPFPRACRAMDTTMANALLRFYSVARAEFLHAKGPCGYTFYGNSSPQLEASGERLRDYFNYYLTFKDKAFYADYSRFLMYFGFCGSIFRKVYIDPMLGLPISRFILPEDFIIDANCTSVTDSDRLTHVRHLSKREILTQQEKGIYREIDLKLLKNDNDEADDDENNSLDKDGLDKSSYENSSLYTIYETHVYLNLDDFTGTVNVTESKGEREAIPLPYIVTFEPNSKEILSIKRNWKEDDLNKVRKNYFVQYNYTDSFGVLGNGLAHILGSLSIVLTSLLRQLVDAGQYKNLPGGIRQKGALKGQNNDLLVGPGQFVEVDNVDDLERAFMLFPFAEPSQVLRSLRLEIRDAAMELGSTSELGMLDSKEDIPTGTMMAGMENQNRIQSAVMKSIHHSFTEELQLLYELFKESMGDNFMEEFQGNLVTAEDFSEDLRIIPVSDPSVNSTIQKIIRAQSILQVAQTDPRAHKMREVYKMNYEAYGIDQEQIDKILRPDPEAMEQEVLALDPSTENINMMMGKPVKAAQWQNHPAHKLVHSVFAENNKDKPELVAQVMAHNTEHDAMDYLNYIQELIGTELPSLEELQDPEVQNAIAMAIAEKLEESGATNMTSDQPLDPSALLLADIQQKEAETQARLEIASQRAETDAFKAQLSFEETKAKIESDENIAKLKAETELTKQGMENSFEPGF